MGYENSIPIYLQLVERIKVQILSGNLRSGERVMSVREWALLERVNPNTMQKALAELESMGLLRTERTNGKFVTSDLELLNFYKKEEANRLACEFLENMKRIGIGYDDAMHYLCNVKGEEKK